MAPPRRYEDSEDFSFERPNKSSAHLWIAGCGLLTCGLLGCLCAGGVGVGYYLWRYDLTNTTWRGTENLAGFGALRFEFKKNNVVIMTDAARVVNGTWTRNGSDVTITFANCQYRGAIDGNVMTGTAHFTDPRFGPRAAPWTFTVTRD